MHHTTPSIRRPGARRAALHSLRAAAGPRRAPRRATTTTVKARRASRTALRDCLKQHGVTLPAGFGSGNGGAATGRDTRARSRPAAHRVRCPRGVDQQKLQSAHPGVRWDRRRIPRRRPERPGASGVHGVPRRSRREGAQANGDRAHRRPSTGTRARFVAANKVCAALLPTRSTTTTTPSN